MSTATQKKKTELPLAQKRNRGNTHRETLAYKKSTGIICERRCGTLILREMLTWSV